MVRVAPSHSVHGVRADEHEQPARRDATDGVVDCDGLQRAVPVQLADLCGQVDADPRVPLDLVYEVARHARGESAPTHAEVDVTAVAGKEDGCLTRRVRPADDHHALALAGLRLDLGRRVEHAGPLEALESIDGQAAVPGAGRNHDGPTVQPLAAGELDDVMAAVNRQATCNHGNAATGPEPLRLQRGALGEIGAGDPRGEPEVVLDSRRSARLPAEGDGIDQDRAEALGRGVNRGAESGGSRPDDHGVRQPRRGPHGPEVQRLSELSVRGIAHRERAAEQQWRVGRSDADLAEQRLGLRIALDVEECVRYPVAGKELVQPPRVGRQPRSDEPQSRSEPDEDRPPRDEGAQDEIPDPLVGSDHPAQLSDSEHDHLAILRRDGRQIRRLPGQEIRPAPEAALSDDGDQSWARRAVLRVSRQRPAGHDVELPCDRAGASEDLAGGDRAPLALRLDHCQQLARKAWEGLLVVELYVGRDHRCHGPTCRSSSRPGTRLVVPVATRRAAWPRGARPGSTAGATRRRPDDAHAVITHRRSAPRRETTMIVPPSAPPPEVTS